jgi:peptide/nickel transport system permease protein
VSDRADPVSSSSEAALLTGLGPPPAVVARDGRRHLLGFALRRLGQGLIVIWLAFTIAFVLLNVLPGDAALAKIGGGGEGAATTVTDAQLDALRAKLGLDAPLYQQYADQLRGLPTLDLGDSMQTEQPVLDVIGSALPNTIGLAAAGFLVAALAGGGLGVAAAYTRRRWLRSAVLSLGALGMAVPPFWVGLALLSLLSFSIHVFPASGTGGLDALVLPAVTLAIVPAAMIMQVLHDSLSHALAQPYTTTAVMKGASRGRVLLHHGLRNALVPVVTLGGVIVGYLVAGSIVVETVFSRPGIGMVLVNAVQAVDLRVVSGLVLLSAIVFVVVNLVVDLLCQLIDPRLGAA